MGYEVHKMTEERITEYISYLKKEERSWATIEKYHRDLLAFLLYLSDSRLVDKSVVIAYKDYLTSHFAPASVNSMLAALNGFLQFQEWHECRVKPIKIQRRVFASEEKELTQAEYIRLVKAAKEKGNERLMLVMETICSTGIRVSELSFITVDAVNCGRATVRCKGKSRTVFLPKKLREYLRSFIRRQQISSGPVFVTRNGRPLDRSNIWSAMKALCKSAGVPRTKVFPHNLRHLFATTYYNIEKDLSRLADLLGHSSVETTRIYTRVSGTEHEKQVGRLGLVV